MRLAPLLFAALALPAAAGACKTRREPAPRERVGSGAPGAAVTPTASAPRPASGRAAAPPALSRGEFNRWAVRLNLPIYWIADEDGDAQIDPGEVAELLFYPAEGGRTIGADEPERGGRTIGADEPERGGWTKDGKLTPAFDAAHRAIAAAAAAPPPEGADARRQQLVGEDLDQGRPTLVRSDLTALSAGDKAFVRRMMAVAARVDELYEKQRGLPALAPRLPPDPASRSLFRRNRGPRCVAPATDKDPACSAIPGAPRPVFDLYPAELQRQDDFCAALGKHPNARALLEDPFTVVRGSGAALRAVPYSEAYRAEVGAIAAELSAAAELAGKDAAEAALAAYLRAAAASFTSNDWRPADEAWVKMNAGNSKWFVRVAPDETYWEPCARKAGVHLSFARINQASREWQRKLAPVRQDMEQQIALRAGPPYAARRVAFQLPDFIDIVINAGDDRAPLGGTAGQSLPNWGPIASGGRGRTIVMSNLYQDPDSRAARRAQAESVLDAASMRAYPAGEGADLLGTILHEATHNLGPAHEYKVAGRTAPVVFGGPLASVMEELKAQAGALFLLELLRTKKLISDEQAAQSYADSIVWALGQISQGMYSGARQPKTYGQVAAIQIGFLIDQGALGWSAEKTAANGKDAGALVIHYTKLVPAVDKLMRAIAGIKARGDVAGARALVARYVDGKVVPHAVIAERFLRIPKPSFVYSVSM